jgi:two-component system response regulator YesN
MLIYHETLSAMQLKKCYIEKALEIKDFLQKNYREHYDYEFLVQKFGITKRKMIESFKEIVNDNIHSFITKVRVQKAKELLESTDYTIEYVACKVGLDKSNLNIQFKKTTGKTPSEWRKEHTSNYTSYLLASGGSHYEYGCDKNSPDSQ